MCAFEATVSMGHTRRHSIQQTELSNLKYFEVHTNGKKQQNAGEIIPTDC
jgi:hypothetical protein